MSKLNSLKNGDISVFEQQLTFCLERISCSSYVHHVSVVAMRTNADTCHGSASAVEINTHMYHI